MDAFEQMELQRLVPSSALRVEPRQREARQRIAGGLDHGLCCRFSL